MTVRRGFMVLLALMVLWLQSRIWIGEGSLAQINALSARIDQQEAANESKRQRNKVLRAEIVDLKNGVASIEEKARSEFGLIKQGETFFLIVDQDKSGKQASEDR